MATTSSTGGMDIGNLTNTSTENTALGAGQAATLNNNDTSLLHQLTRLQTEKQEWLQKQRELENAVKDTEQKLKATQEKFEKEHAEFVAKQKKEMEEQFKNFMEEWMSSMSKESPEVIEQVKEGAKQLINGGRSKDRVWELLCCASKTHKMNVNTIEELRETNRLLSTQNETLQKELRTADGFDDYSSRMAKRARPASESHTLDMPGGHVDPASAESVPITDVWGQFEQLMTSSTGRGTYCQ